MTSRLPSSVPSVVPPHPSIPSRLPTRHSSTHPFHQTPRKVDHLLPCFRDEAERVDPVATLSLGLDHRIGPVLIEEDEEFDETGGRVNGEEEGGLGGEGFGDEIWRGEGVKS